MVEGQPFAVTEAINKWYLFVIASRGRSNLWRLLRRSVPCLPCLPAGRLV